MASEFQVREFNPFADYEMVCEWWVGHRKEPIPLELLPECGIVAHAGDDDLMAGWVYFDTTTPVCFASHLVSRPKLPLLATLKASEAICRKAKELALHQGAQVMQMYAPPGIARQATRRMGFVADDRPLVNLSVLLMPEEEEFLCHF
jgi:hypothetical protein